jgi:hypothetical protein
VDFKVVVSSADIKRSSTINQKISFVANPQLKIWIKCVKHCPNAAVSSTFHAEVICDDCRKDLEKKFRWILNSQMLPEISQAVILPNSLTEGKHLLKVTVEQGNQKGEAEMLVNILKSPSVICSIAPPKGIEFTTEFSIECDLKTFEVFQDNNLVKKFYSGRGLLRLKASSQILVRAYQTFSSIAETNVDVDVEELKIDDVSSFVLGSSISPLHHLISTNDIASAGVMIRIASKLMTEENVALTTEVVNEISRIRLIDPESIVITTGLLKVVSEKANLNWMVRKKLADMLGKIEKSLGDITEITLNHTKSITSDIQAVVEELSTTLPLMNLQEIPIIPSHLRFDEYAEYETFDSDIIARMEICLSVGNHVEEIFKTLFGKLVKFVKSAEPAIEMNFQGQSLKVFAKNFEEFSVRTSSSHEFKVASKTKAKVTGKSMAQRRIKIGFTSFKSNHPFWFVEDNNASRSDVVILQVFDEEDRKIEKFSEPIKILHELKKLPTVEHSICVENTGDMPIFHVQLSKFSKLLIEYKVADGRTLNCLLQFNKKPQLKDFILNRSEVKAINGSASLEIASMHNNGELFIAFLPSKSNSGQCIDLHLNFHKISCEFWNGTNAAWTTEKCRVGQIVNAWTFECLCLFPGTLTATVDSTSAMLDPSRAIIATLFQNFIVLTFSTVIYLLLALVAVLLCSKKSKKNLIHLKSNHPNDEYLYIIAIATGNLKNSETSSKICMRIFGKDSTSEAIWFENDGVSFTRKSEWKFLLATQTSLGDVEKIAVWIKPSGHNISWFVDRISIADALSEKLWEFRAQKWFSLKGNQSIVFHQLTPTKSIKHECSLYRQNLLHELAGSVLSSTVEGFKKHIVTIVAVLVIVLICNALQYKQTTELNVEDEHFSYQHFEIARVLEFAVYGGAICIAFKIAVDALINLFSFLKQ